MDAKRRGRPVIHQRLPLHKSPPITEFSFQNMQNRPPVAPARQGSDRLSRSSKSSGSSSQQSGSKLSSRHSSSTDSSSGSATNSNGRALLQDRISSLLSHDLALPLFHALHGRDPGKQVYLGRESRSIPDTSGDRILEEAIRAWALLPQTLKREPTLARHVSELIQGSLSEQLHIQSDHEVEVNQLCNSQQKAHRRRRIDILLSSKESPSTPLALIEIGHNKMEWWKKLDQAGKNLDMMNDDTDSMDQMQEFQDAMLCAVLTVEGDGDTQGFQSQFAVFLCWPKTVKSRRYCRMALLWHARTFDLMLASKDFGRFLRVVSSFAAWRKAGPNADYKYLSSNVCRVGNTVSGLPKCGLTLWHLFSSRC